MKYKLNDEQCATIYAAYNNGARVIGLAKQYDVSETTIRAALSRAKAKLRLATGALPEFQNPNIPKIVYHWIGNSKQISVFSETDVFTIMSSHKRFDEVRQLLMHNYYQAAIEIINVKEALKVFVRGNIEIKGGSLSYKGIVCDTSLTKRIIASMEAGEDSTKYLNFFEKLMLNPSRDAVYQLFDFLAHNDIEINEDGTFTAWKRVSDDYKDLYTGNFDNSVGTRVWMPRNQVDENKNQTCSFGFHVAAASYIPHYHGGYGRIVACIVNPRDVVAIPTDYNNAKMRVNEYVVKEDVTSKF